MENSEAVAALGALAQESRLEVFRLLVRTGADGMPAGDIGERLNIPPATLSFHLAQLRHAGLVTMKRDGRSLIYSADYDGMDDLMSFLTEKCCAGAVQRVIPVCDPASATVVRRTLKKRLKQ